MKQKPYACFGYVLLANLFEAGEVFYAKKDIASTDVLLVTEGRVKSFDKDSGDFIGEYYPGCFALPYNDIHNKIEVMEDTTLFCFSAALNKGFVPALEPVVVNEGDKYEFNPNTKFFMCKGEININNSKFSGPCQILVQGAQSFTADSDVYGLIIK